MKWRDEKSLSFDEFKKEVYKRIGTLEIGDGKFIREISKSENKGCFSFVITFLTGGFYSVAVAETDKLYKITELTAKADEILAQPEIRDLICANLDAAATLPIDIAYKLTPVLYELALKDEEKLPLNSTLFAIICRKITDQDVQNYCR